MRMTESEVVRALREIMEQADEQADGYFTSDELVEASGAGITRVRSWLKAAKRAGRLDVRIVQRENIVGVMRPTPGYRITEDAEE